ncbi:hypothetical protein AAFF_G00113090 [Aldrovandia affinis]|uniref:Uncharacterized protein n=1 Tax=Aldrovandia affinis TaxID=143900 RepID=A0AAD7RTB2_9TELE|nr:hypothetical protein AAFF_G00113090 [Aldrovandia affinis]
MRGEHAERGEVPSLCQNLQRCLGIAHSLPLPSSQSPGKGGRAALLSNTTTPPEWAFVGGWERHFECERLCRSKTYAWVRISSRGNLVIVGLNGRGVWRHSCGPTERSNSSLSGLRHLVE